MAGKQSSAAGQADAMGVPEQVRQAAETSLSQARQAVDQYLDQMSSMHDKIQSSVEAAQTGAREMKQNVWAAAEANIDAAFDFARALVQARNPQEVATLQQQFLQRQLERVSTQLQEAGGAAARPKG